MLDENSTGLETLDALMSLDADHWRTAVARLSGVVSGRFETLPRDIRNDIAAILNQETQAQDA